MHARSHQPGLAAFRIPRTTLHAEIIRRGKGKKKNGGLSPCGILLRQKMLSGKEPWEFLPESFAPSAGLRGMLRTIEHARSQADR
jgi:hypothetical protein